METVLVFWLPRNPQFWLLTGIGLSPFLKVINEPGPLKFHFQVLPNFSTQKRLLFSMSLPLRSFPFSCILVQPSNVVSSWLCAVTP